MSDYELTAKFTFLPHCWVCRRKFSASLKDHDHHVIPRAYGGVDGPQVRVCDTHHSALHDIALRLYARKPFNDLLSGDNDTDKRLIYLASLACNARIATENDPNRRRVLVLTPKKETLQQLDALKQRHGSRISRERLIEIAVKTLYDKHFIK